MKNKVLEGKPSSGAELVKVIKKIWKEEISTDYCQNWIKSMMGRMQAVIKNRRGHSKY